MLIAVIATACDRRPKNILSEDKMVAVMADIQIAEAYERSGEADSYLHGENRELLGRGVLLKHGVSVEEMDSTIAWYGRNMDEYAKLYKKIDEELNRRQQKYAKAAGEVEREMNSNDLWPYGRHFIVDDNSMTDGIIASIPVTDLQPGDKITWKFRVMGASAAMLSLGVDYDNGSSEIYKLSERGMDKWVEASIQTDTTLVANRIFAIADFDRISSRVLIDSMQLIHVPINRNEYNQNGFKRLIPPAGRKIVLPPDSSANSNLVPDSITLSPSSSTGKSLGFKTRE